MGRTGTTGRRRLAMSVAGRAAVVATGLVAASTVAFAGQAGATTAAPAALATCPNGLMEATYDVKIYSGWESTRVIGEITRGDRVRCNSGYDLGRRYTLCGVSNGNGWVRLVANDGTRGWAAQGCFRDL